MECVPRVISTKDLAYLNDMFKWNFNAYKQIKHYSSEVENDDIKEFLEVVATMHHNHLNYIIAILKGEDVDSFDKEDDLDEE